MNILWQTQLFWCISFMSLFLCVVSVEQYALTMNTQTPNECNGVHDFRSFDWLPHVCACRKTLNTIHRQTKAHTHKHTETRVKFQNYHKNIWHNVMTTKQRIRLELFIFCLKISILLKINFISTEICLIKSIFYRNF